MLTIACIFYYIPFINSGHSSVKTCQRIMANVQLIGNVRRLYSAKEGFDVHPTTKHTEQSPFPDQMKGMWFCIREGMFEYVSERKDVLSFQVDPGTSKPIPKSVISVYEKGSIKVKDNLYRKLHECFPSMRKVTFMRIVEGRDEA